MEQRISIGIAKYFFNKGLELDIDNVVCRDSGDTQTYLYNDDLILTADLVDGEIELHYAEDVK